MKVFFPFCVYQTARKTTSLESIRQEKKEASVVLSWIERAHLSKRCVQRTSHPIIAVHKARFKGGGIHSFTLNTVEVCFSADECHLTGQNRESLCVLLWILTAPCALMNAAIKVNHDLTDSFKAQQHVFLDKLFEPKQWRLKLRYEFRESILLKNHL